MRTSDMSNGNYSTKMMTERDEFILRMSRIQRVTRSSPSQGDHDTVPLFFSSELRGHHEGMGNY